VPTVPLHDTPRVTRTCRFGPLEIEFDDRVLTPRPWTFEQSSWAAQLSSSVGPGPILELCAGAGQIGLAAAVLADRDLVQVELDPVAAGWALANAARAGRSARVEVRTAHLAQALRTEETFPLALADPPYLRSDDRARWPDDPALAIDGGPDGLDVVRACLAVATGHLEPGAPLLLQVAGAGQADEVARLGDADAFEIRETRAYDSERAVLLLVRR
jgi:release factor glutamine methyltransferase